MEQQPSLAISNQVAPPMRFTILLSALLIGSCFSAPATEAETFTVISNLKSPVSPTLPDYSDSVNVLEAELIISGSISAVADTAVSGNLLTEFDVSGTTITELSFSTGTITLSDFEHFLGFLGTIFFEDLAATGLGVGSVAIPPSGEFDASTQGFLINSGKLLGGPPVLEGFEIDFGIPTNNLLVTGNDVQLAFLDQSVSGGNILSTVTVPIDTTFRLADDLGGIDLRLRGNLVADSSLSLTVIPEPANGALLACGLMVSALSRRRSWTHRSRAKS